VLRDLEAEVLALTPALDGVAEQVGAGRAVGPDHTDLAHVLGNLAFVDNYLGAYAEARALHERALAIREKAFGPDHPDGAKSLAGLANLDQENGAYTSALALHRRALAIREMTLGPITWTSPTA
jgi:tetratricopeptide (TPR) repeat protein